VRPPPENVCATTLVVADCTQTANSFDAAGVTLPDDAEEILDAHAPGASLSKAAACAVSKSPEISRTLTEPLDEPPLERTELQVVLGDEGTLT
jgi:hypothetical protein